MSERPRAVFATQVVDMSRKQDVQVAEDSMDQKLEPGFVVCRAQKVTLTRVPLAHRSNQRTNEPTNRVLKYAAPPLPENLPTIYVAVRGSAISCGARKQEALEHGSHNKQKQRRKLREWMSTAHVPYMQRKRDHL